MAVTVLFVQLVQQKLQTTRLRQGSGLVQWATRPEEDPACADSEGSILDNPPLAEEIAQDGLLQGMKMIAWAPDDSLLPRAGARGFPHWGIWAERNKLFTEDVVAYMAHCMPGLASKVATRWLLLTVPAVSSCANSVCRVMACAETNETDGLFGLKDSSHGPAFGWLMHESCRSCRSESDCPRVSSSVHRCLATCFPVPSQLSNTACCAVLVLPC